jgi:putative membrane protein
MQNPNRPLGGPYGTPYGGGYPARPSAHPYRWLFVGLGILLAFVGVALVLVILSPTTFGYRPATGIGPFGLFGGFFLVILLVWIVIWIARIGMWSARPGGYSRGMGRGRRYGAFAIARERYARGEITREQFDQIMQDLERQPGYPPADVAMRFGISPAPNDLPRARASRWRSLLRSSSRRYAGIGSSWTGSVRRPPRHSSRPKTRRAD